jgi:hypothetical protein
MSISLVILEGNNIVISDCRFLRISTIHTTSTGSSLGPERKDVNVSSCDAQERATGALTPHVPRPCLAALCAYQVSPVRLLVTA